MRVRYEEMNETSKVCHKTWSQSLDIDSFTTIFEADDVSIADEWDGYHILNDIMLRTYFVKCGRNVKMWVQIGSINYPESFESPLTNDSRDLIEP
jgi:hypothetical protein